MSIDLQAVGTAAAFPVESARSSAATDPHETFLRNKNFGSLNGIRCICCLAVIKEHVLWNFPGPRLFSLGFLGVDLFFVISGFLIVTLLIRERERKGTVDLRKFYARRSLRIFPIYYLSIFAVFALYAAISPWRPNGLRFYGPSFLVLLTYTQDLLPVRFGNFSPCWTLAMEEQFYMVWPTVEKFAAKQWRWMILAGGLILNLAVNFGFFDGLIMWIYGDRRALVRPMILITFSPILLGVLLAYLLNERRSFGVFYKLVGYRWSPFLFLAVLFAICEVKQEIVPGWTKLAVHLNFMLMLASMVVREDHFARPLLAFRPIARLGVISYGIYLYHMWVINLMEIALGRLMPGRVDRGILFVCATIGTIAVAEASFRLIEEPLLRYKERFHS